MFTAALFTIGKKWKQFEYSSTEEWIKRRVVYIYNGILFSYRKDKPPSFTATWMELEIVILSEIRHRKTSVI